jgi:hypothetical protein
MVVTVHIDIWDVTKILIDFIPTHVTKRKNGTMVLVR